MKLFPDLKTAYFEMKRDLSKAPQVNTQSVQNIHLHNQMAKEVIGYSYAIEEIPLQPFQIVDVAISLGLIPKEDKGIYTIWLDQETRARLRWQPGISTEKINPHLSKLEEVPAYTYMDRLRGMVETMVGTLIQDPTSRRCYWPMFTQEDAQRAWRGTRIPCTIGYWAAIRPTSEDYRLHFTYLQRSCDFNKFWIWDIYFAHFLQQSIYDQLCIELKDKDWVFPFKMGVTSHHILSFHSFLGGEEIY